MNVYFYKAKLVRVIDGDTIVATIDLGFNMYMDKAIRFYDVNTYEIRGTLAHPLGNEAKKVVEDMMAENNGEFYFMSHKDKIDLYARLLGTIFIPVMVDNGTNLNYVNLNKTLANSGYDRVLDNYTNGEILRVYEDIQVEYS